MRNVKDETGRLLSAPLQNLAKRASTVPALRVDAQPQRQLPVVIVVDDDAGVREGMQALLGDEFHVRACATSAEAHAAVDSEAAAVVLDIRMPGQDGFEICRALRKRFKHVPIIFHSAYQDVKDPYEVINNYKPFAYVTKGSLGTMLLPAVRQAVAHSQDIWQCSRLSRRVLVRSLKALLVALNADEAAFLSASDGVLRIEATVRGPNHNGATDAEVTADATIDLRKVPEGAGGMIEIPAKSRCKLGVRLNGAQLGFVFITWHGPTSTTRHHATEAQKIADEIAFTEVGNVLNVRRLQKRARQEAVKKRNIRARLDALISRVNPHFLYNCLNSIAALIHSQPDDAEQMVLELGDVFRHVLKQSDRETVAVSEELVVVRAYLAIERRRLGERLRLVFRSDQKALAAAVPPLLLLPLVENAVTHGVASRENGATVQVLITGASDHVQFVVTDDGTGEGNATHYGTGRSLRDLRRRLHLAYGKNAFFVAKKSAKGGFTAILRLPLSGKLKCLS